MYNLPAVRTDVIAVNRGWLFLAFLGVAAAVLVALAGPGMLFPFVMLALLYGGFRLATGPLPALISRLPVSIRWKILAGICLMGGLLLLVTFVNVQAMDYMHQELHEIQDLGVSNPAVLPAVNQLEDTQHGLFFSLAPLVSVLAGLLAVVVGVAIAISVIEPIHRMGVAMRKIASGDFSEPIAVSNRDELGELATSINSTAEELAQLQEARLADERARALRERITQVTLAQEEERRRISRELHDGLGPSLAAIANRLRTCQHTIAESPVQAQTELDEITQSLKGHIQDIRHLIYDLRPLAVDQLGLRGAVQQQLDRLAKETGVEAVSEMTDEIFLDPLCEITAFRIVQECLTNIQKHSGASRVDFRIRRVTDGVELTVRDNGRGFPARRAPVGAASEGVGLVIMRERAELVGARLSVQSSPGKGCNVALVIPDKEREVGSHPNPAG